MEAGQEGRRSALGDRSGIFVFFMTLNELEIAMKRVCCVRIDCRECMRMACGNFQVIKGSEANGRERWEMEGNEVIGGTWKMENGGLRWEIYKTRTKFKSIRESLFSSSLPNLCPNASRYSGEGVLFCGYGYRITGIPRI